MHENIHICFDIDRISCIFYEENRMNIYIFFLHMIDRKSIIYN
jgi:hypothetical protein